MILEFGIFAAIVCIFLLIFISKSIYLVRQSEVMVIEKFGKFNRVLHPGIHFVIPFAETPHQVTWTFIYQGEGKRYYRVTKQVTRIDMREAVYDFPKQNVITKDNVTMEINALLYYQITDPKAAMYEVYDLAEAIEKLTQTTLRNVIGSLDLDESLVSRDQINEKLRIILDEATDKWGVKVNRVELQEVNPPADIRQAMEKQMRAERDRRAVILEAEGKKRAAILQAEGAQEAAVLDARGEAESKAIRAQGEANARLQIVQAEATAIGMIQEAVPGVDPLPYMIALNYIKMMPELTAGKNDKLVLVPYEASSLAGSLTAMKKMFEEIK